MDRKLSRNDQIAVLYIQEYVKRFGEPLDRLFLYFQAPHVFRDVMCKKTGEMVFESVLDKQLNWCASYKSNI